MPTVRALLGLVTCSLLASGCVFYFNGDDDDEPPVPDAGIPVIDGGPCLPVPRPPPVKLRDPYTGQCSDFGGGGGPCGDDWGAPAPLPSWGPCENECNALDEKDCLVADACRGIYTIAADGQQAFAACWAVAADGPVRGGDCTAIGDAFECSQHDDCAAQHDVWQGAPSTFIACQAEPDPTDPPPPPPECAGLAEPACIDMADGCFDWHGQPVCGGDKCEPIYAGSGCTCDPATGTCTCQQWDYERCRSATP